MSEEDFEDTLEDFYQVGTFDSEGSFRLSADKAREKLANFQLAEPSQYICHLFSAGLLAGATEARFQLGYWSSLLSFEGTDWKSDDLRDVFSHLLAHPQSGREWALHELSLAFQSAPRGGVKLIEVRYPGLKSEMLDNLVKFADGEKFEVRLRHRRTFWQVIGDILTAQLPAQKSTELATLKRTLVTSGCCRATVEAGSENWTVPTLKELEVRAGQVDPLASTTIDGGWVTIGRDGSLGKRKHSQLHLLIRGRLHQLPLRIGRCRIRAWQRADELTLDLSQREPVKNAAFLKRHQELLRAVARLQKQVLLESKNLSEKERRGLLREVARALRGDAKLHECLSLLSDRAYEEVRRASIGSMLGELEAACEGWQKEVSRKNMPQGLLPSRLFNLAAIQARLRQSACFDTWSEGYQMVISQHGERKGHLVGEALEKKLTWYLDWGPVGEDHEQMWLEAKELKRGLGKAHRRQATTLELGAYLYLKLRQPQRALDLASSAEQLRSDSEGKGNPSIGQSLTLMALAQNELGLSEAFTSAKRRFSLMSTVYGPSHPEVAASHYLLALLGPKEERQTHIESASEVLSELSLPMPPEDFLVLCYRGWFHPRTAWDCAQPLLWKAIPPGDQP